MSTFIPQRVRADIPELRRVVHGRPLTYLDSGATSLLPRAVIEAMSRYYELRHSNVHRSVFVTAAEATQEYEGARHDVATFIDAPGGANEVVFTKNTTESFNLFVKSWGRAHLSRGSVVVLSEMEHHANLVPWFQLRDEIGIDIRFLGTTDEYRLDLSRVDELFSDARVVSLTGMSNVLGTINPIKELAARAHDVGALVVLDAAQLIGHTAVSVRELGVDVACFSAHKMLGPTGIGVLWARYDILESMPPFLGGGGMIEDVSLDGFRPAGVPTRFEAGTPPIAEAAGLRAAIRYLTGLGMDNIATYERGLTSYALDRLQGDFGGRVRIIGPGTVQARGGVLSLDVKGVHPHDVAQVLDEYGVCVRPGHHCAKPLMKRFGLHATARASFGPYSSTDDVDVLSEALHAALARFT